ncbi:extracellular solute-binding protein [Rhizobium sp. CFBP 8762]|uniref:ABC transporter substrate-binding protein n=1 Tax=Rhizobium sp. CFBP 8762 TaxID=2775279 RepID=UPI00177E57EC|nr:extracellular solute-binding protein [Rhizobium sp. CFBP 8762]MBD8555012.1 extracellular solute-binding protein [Rhizobium sp. CFBP 8762]
MITKRSLVKAMGTLTLAVALMTPAFARADTLPERFADLYEHAKKEGQVVFYTSYRQETSTAVLEFWRNTFPDVRLNIVQKQTLDLIPTIEAEKAAGRTNPDVTFISQRFILNTWRDKGWLTAYKVRDFEKISGNFREDSGYFTAVAASLLSAAYNPKVFPDPSVLPKKITDFLDPKWKGRIVFSDPRTAASQLTWFQTLLAHKIIDWDTIKGLGQQDFLFTRGNAESVRLLVAGERDLSPLISSQNVITARERGQSIQSYILDEGVVANENYLAIFENGPNPAAAKLLLEVLSSAEGQAVVANAGSYIPTHPDTPIPGGLPRLSDLKIIVADQDIGGEASQKFLEQFDDAFNRQ